ncbi:MAG: hypothetical protein HZA88_16410 [Verrucomicrobia bacterium]|nr:hypothetical protein [Verrucomicrobiota bacterium]
MASKSLSVGGLLKPVVSSGCTTFVFALVPPMAKLRSAALTSPCGETCGLTGVALAGYRAANLFNEIFK